MNKVKAYNEREYEGNLLDLLSLFSSFDREKKVNIPNKIKEFPMPVIDKFWRDTLPIIDFKVDNRNTIYFFNDRAKGNCESEVCISCTLSDDNRNLVKMNEKIKTKISSNFEDILKHLEIEGN